MGWHVTFTHNHWPNEETTIDYINLIFLPYVKKKRKELKNIAAPFLVIFYRVSVDSVLDLLEENNI